jgi:hypothetical protein
MCKQHDPLRTVTLLARLYHTGMFIQHREVGITKSPMVRGARSYFREAMCRPCLRLGFEEYNYEDLLGKFPRSMPPARHIGETGSNAATIRAIKS